MTTLWGRKWWGSCRAILWVNLFLKTTWFEERASAAHSLNGISVYDHELALTTRSTSSQKLQQNRKWERAGMWVWIVKFRCGSTSKKLGHASQYCLHLSLGLKFTAIEHKLLQQFAVLYKDGVPVQKLDVVTKSDLMISNDWKFWLILVMQMHLVHFSWACSCNIKTGLQNIELHW